MADNNFNQTILESLGASEVLKSELIQELWSGYGELSRITTDRGPVIVKHIQFPREDKHPRGWASDLGHKRKKRSYEVERNWYQNYQTRDSRMADCLGYGESEGDQFLLLEDLGSSGFAPKSHIEWEKVELCLKWLAHFHQNFLGQSPTGLWPVGTYWHLATRPDELEALEDDALKSAASLIDQKLNESEYQTIVHGDAKLANFLFNTDDVAAVDFQYVGGGVGIKDVAYFMSSIYDEDELASHEEKCLDSYFKFLNHPEVEKEWRELYAFAWTDFYRFLKGWSPGHWKINSYSEKLKDEVLRCL